MSVLDTTPVNLNPLSPLTFQFNIKKCPTVNFFCQKVPIPGMELGLEYAGNPFIQVPIPGDHLEFEDLEISFQVDEDLTNYLEIHNWMRALGKPEDFGEYAAIKAIPQYTGEGIYSDLTLLIQNSKRNTNREVVFLDAFPTALSRVDFDATMTDIVYLVATARFAYRTYIINPVS